MSSSVGITVGGEDATVTVSTENESGTLFRENSENVTSYPVTITSPRYVS